MTYRAELSGRALKQMHGLPGPAFDRLIETMAHVTTTQQIYSHVDEAAKRDAITRLSKLLGGAE